MLCHLRHVSFKWCWFSLQYCLPCVLSDMHLLRLEEYLCPCKLFFRVAVCSSRDCRSLPIFVIVSRHVLLPSGRRPEADDCSCLVGDSGGSSKSGESCEFSRGESCDYWCGECCEIRCGESCKFRRGGREDVSASPESPAVARALELSPLNRDEKQLEVTATARP